MNLSIRKATPLDAPAIARVHVTSWQETYRGIVHQPYLDTLDVASRTENWKSWFDQSASHIYVAEINGQLCGFTGGGAAREPIEDFDAEIYAIYILNAAKGQGIGRQLIHHLAETLHTNAFTKAMLWVLADNPSRGFYHHLGGKQIAQKQIHIADANLQEIAYGWHDLRTL
jgi:ribosomal protein S18 acetylase RimI-like enzyme